MTDNSKPLLRDEDLAHIGKASDPHQEIVNRRDIKKYSIATNQIQQRYLDGDVAPPLFHVALTRAMAGGLHIEYHRPIKPADELIAVRTLTNVYEKAGRSGALIFYEVVLAVTNNSGEPVVTETTTRILR